MIPIEIVVPIAACQMYKYTPQPAFSEERLEYLHLLHTNKSTLPMPVGRPNNGGYEVAKGWDLISLLHQSGEKEVRMLSTNYDDSQMMRMAMVEHVADIQGHWLGVAEAIVLAKSELKLSDSDISMATGIDRSRVNRFVRVAKKLPGHFKAMAKVGSLKYSTCYKLAAKSHTELYQLELDALEKGWDESRILQHGLGKIGTQGSSGDKHGNISTESTLPVEKSSALKQLEVVVSEASGAPYAIIPRDATEKSGTMEFKFFDMSSLEGLAALIARVGGQGRVRGSITFDFENLDDLDAVTGGFLESE